MCDFDILSVFSFAGGKITIGELQTVKNPHP
jgi:hypothetical protein